MELPRRSLRHGLGAGLLALWLSLLLASAAGARQILFVGNLNDGTASLVDAHALRVLGTLNLIPDGNTPQDPKQAAVYGALVAAKGINYVQGLAVSPDGRTLYVSRGYLGDVAAFDIASHRMLWRLQTDSLRADHIALSPDGRRLFVSALTANQVQVIDTRTHQFIGSFATGDWPHVIELSRDGRYVYVGSLGNQLLPDGVPTSKTITVADARTLRVVRTFSFDAGVRPFAFTPDGRLMYVQLSKYNGFVEVDARTGAILRRRPLPVRGPAVGESADQYPNQAAHHGIALSLDGRLICDAATVSNYVALVARPSLAVRAIIPVADQPADAEASLDGRYCFASDRGPSANVVSVVSFARRREVARVTVGQHPQELAEAEIPLRVLVRGGYAHPRAARRRHPHRRRHAHHRRRGGKRSTGTPPGAEQEAS